MPGLSVSLGLWQDRAPGEVLRTARVADELGYGEIWIGEMATFDAFALAAVIAERTERAALTVGPLARPPLRMHRDRAGRVGHRGPDLAGRGQGGRAGGSDQHSRLPAPDQAAGYRADHRGVR